MKYIKIFFALEFVVCGIIGITQYIKTSEAANILASIFSFIIAFLLLRSARKKKSPKNSENILNVTVHQSNSPSATPVPEVSYIKNDKMIVRTDGKEITDNEVPYLVQIGRDSAISKWKAQELIRLITESYRIMQTTDNPETLCRRYNFIVEKVKELVPIEQQGLLDINTFNQYKVLISDDNFYSLIMSCYQKYAIKAQSELKTQSGINKRIDKFWKTIRTNVSTEFYNTKIRKT